MSGMSGSESKLVVEEEEEDRLPFHCDSCNSGFETQAALKEHHETAHSAVKLARRQSLKSINLIETISGGGSGVLFPSSFPALLHSQNTHKHINTHIMLFSPK